MSVEDLNLEDSLNIYEFYEKILTVTIQELGKQAIEYKGCRKLNESVQNQIVHKLRTDSWQTEDC